MKLARVNNILTTAIVVINLFIFCMPFVPAAWFWIRQTTTDSGVELQEKVDSDEVPDGNRIIIPSILMDEEIFSGPTIATLNKGLWHQPNGTSPGMPGQTVIAGHRFTYNDPEGAFYHLDKLDLGNEIAVYWDNQKYLYVVTDKYIVDAKHQLEPSSLEQLILYTCTPIWNPKDRLIIAAERFSPGENL